MATTLQYIAGPPLELYFVDKETGLPLSAGQINFYSDVNRTTPKSIFKQTGSPPDYTYTDIGASFTLSASGTFDDGLGNNIIPFYYPYDVDGNIELYYIEVLSATNIPQFQREGWPPGVVGSQPSDQQLNVTNFVPNGQFLLHNNIPANVTTNTVLGQITGPFTQIAAGGWSFQRPISTTSNDNVTFFRYASYVTDPSGSPRYACRVACNAPNPSDTSKYLALRFGDVNKFASNTQQYTYTFSAVSDNSVNFPVTVYVLKNFGSGGSPTTLTNITTFTVTNINQTFSTPIIFGDNIGKNIGVNDGDYVEIILGLPTSFAFAGIFTDFSLLIGDVANVAFPAQTNRDFITRTLTPPVNNPDGFTLGLPIIQTRDGFSYDTSQIGKIYTTILYYPGYGELSCDGSVYRTDAYSADGIPYARLYKNLTDTPVTVGTLGNFGIAMFGTGSTYVTATMVSTNVGVIATNQPGSQLTTVDGLVPTGFTFTTCCTGQPSIGFNSWTYGTPTNAWYICTSAGYVTAGLTNSGGCPQLSINNAPISSQGEVVGSAVAQQMMAIRASGVPAASTYIQIANPTTQYKIWFTLDGAGAMPGGTGTPLQVNMLSSMGANDAIYVLTQAISGYQVSTFSTLPGSSITPNSYFRFYANSQLYYVWYNLNGAGIDPAILNGIGIPVVYTTSDTAQTVLVNTLIAINRMYFATPDLRGWTIKGWSGTPDNLATDDVNWPYRFFRNGTNYDNPDIGLPGYIGSYQKDVLLSHSHIVYNYNNIPTASDYVLSVITNGNWSSTRSSRTSSDQAFNLLQEYGTGQNDMKNVYLNFVIKY